MKLIASLTSPFARKVRVMLAEKNMPCELQVDIPWNADTQVPQYNPLGKIPVLVLDDGSTVFDSRVIVEYLEAEKAWPVLIPLEDKARIAVKRWEALADGISDAAASIFLERKRADAQQSAVWIARQQQKIDLGLRALSADLKGKSWCVGETFSLADIAVGCTLGYLDLRFPEIVWRAQYPVLRELAEKLAARESFKGTVPPDS